MKLIVGLGNPGLEYMSTRHNAGFMVVDSIAQKLDAAFKNARSLSADITKVEYRKVEIVLAKPVTYMNLSGRAVQAILHWYKIPISDLLVVHDDVSLPLGRIRMQSGGGAGGQHGVESIIEMLGGRTDFDRIKFGVGPDPGGDRRADYVLSRFPEPDKALLEKVIEQSRKAVFMWMDKGATVTANAVNGVDLAQPPKPPKPPKPAPAAITQAPEAAEQQTQPKTD